jgi:MoxR-like ATPase
MFFITVKYPLIEEERRIARETTGAPPGQLDKLIDGPQVIAYQELVQRVPVPDHVYDSVVDLVRMSRPHDSTAPDWIKRWVTWGAGPRAVQYLVKGAKAHAVLNGSYLVRMEDVEAVLHPVLTHRILTNFQAQSEGVASEEIINRLWAELQGAEKRG